MVEVTAAEHGVTMGEAGIESQANVDGAAGDREIAIDDVLVGVSALDHSVQDMICRRRG